MVINLSEETIKTVYNCLRCSKYVLNRQLNNEVHPNKIEIMRYQLAEVENTLAVFDELIEYI